MNVHLELVCVKIMKHENTVEFSLYNNNNQQITE